MMLSLLVAPRSNVAQPPKPVQGLWCGVMSLHTGPALVSLQLLLVCASLYLSYLRGWKGLHLSMVQAFDTEDTPGSRDGEY